MIDIERIKTEVPITSLIAKHFAIVENGNVWTTHEHNSLKIFTDTNSYYWYSKNDGSGQGGSTIDWLINEEGMTRKAAMDTLWAMLGGTTAPAGAPRRMVTTTVKREPAPEAWQGELWQQKAQELRASLTDIFSNQAAGKLGRDYLAARGIQQEAAETYSIGYNPIARSEAYEDWGLPPETKANGQPRKVWIPKGIVIFWTKGDMITGIRFRALESKDYFGISGNTDKYLSLRGSRGYLFGTQNLFTLESYKPFALIVVEGELNAISIAQAIQEAMLYGVDVVSVGSQGITERTKNELLRKEPGYKQIISLMDEQKNTLAMQKIIPRAWAFRSLPKLDGNGNEMRDEKGKALSWDANDLLKDGSLGDFVWYMLKEAGA